MGRATRLPQWVMAAALAGVLVFSLYQIFSHPQWLSVVLCGVVVAIARAARP